MEELDGINEAASLEAARWWRDIRSDENRSFYLEHEGRLDAVSPDRPPLQKDGDLDWPEN